MNLFYVAAQLSANSLKKKMRMMMETARKMYLSQEPLSCDMGVSVAHDTCIELEVVLVFVFFLRTWSHRVSYFAYHLFPTNIIIWGSFS